MAVLTKSQLQELRLLERLSPLDWDFEFVKELPEHIQRMAAFWEYARESERLIKLAKAFGKVAFQKSKKAGRKLLAQFEGSIRIDELLLLTTEFFPALPFEDYMRLGLLSKRFEGFTDFGIVDLICKPVETLAASLAADEMEDWLQPGQTLYGLSIPWNYTDHELTSQFGQLLKSLRPVNKPEPRRAGRAGRASLVHPCDMLNQLGALRLDREGISFSGSADVTSRRPYTSKKGWSKGIKKARQRIEDMGRQSFFRRS